MPGGVVSKAGRKIKGRFSMYTTKSGDFVLTTKDIKKLIRQKFAWPGGYEIFFITSDGAVLCAKCARENWRQVCWAVRHNDNSGWKIEGYDLDCNLNEAVMCDHCAKSIGPESEVDNATD